jgi:hypothetical protein
MRWTARRSGIRVFAVVLLLFPSCVLPLHHLGDEHHAVHLPFQFRSDAPQVPASLQAADTSRHVAGGQCLLCLLMDFAPLAEQSGSPDACTPETLAVAHIRSGEVSQQLHPAGTASPRAPPRAGQDIAASA